MTDRNRELVPDSWSLVRERALTIGLGSEGWHILDTKIAKDEFCLVLPSSCLVG